MNEKYELKLEVKSAPAIDREKLTIRINGADKPSNINWYSYVNMRIPATGKQIVCKLYGDDIKEIADSEKTPGFIRINEPLRGKLGISIGQNILFTIKRQPHYFAWYYFIRYHPDDYVSVSTWIAIIAVALGITAIVISCIK